MFVVIQQLKQNKWTSENSKVAHVTGVLNKDACNLQFLKFTISTDINETSTQYFLFKGVGIMNIQ